MPDNSNQTTGEGSAVVKHSEALIERATWVRSKRRGSLLVVSLRIQGRNGESHKMHDVFSKNVVDQNRLKCLCRALGIDHRKLCLDDLVGRKLDIAEQVLGSTTGLQTMDFPYFPWKGVI